MSLTVILWSGRFPPKPEPLEKIVVHQTRVKRTEAIYNKVGMLLVASSCSFFS